MDCTTCELPFDNRCKLLMLQMSRNCIISNNVYYQGLILTVGNLKNYQTYLPNQDKNKLFLNERLGDLSTLNKIPMYSYDNLVKRSSTIDAIWFNERMMPHSFFEVEHSTDIQNSLLKFNDLQDFHSRMQGFLIKRNLQTRLQPVIFYSFAT